MYLNKPKVPCNGSVLNPATSDYTNIPMAGVPSSRRAAPYNAPNAPQYGYKGSDDYDPVRYVFGPAYTY